MSKWVTRLIEICILLIRVYLKTSGWIELVSGFKLPFIPIQLVEVSANFDDGGLNFIFFETRLEQKAS